MNQALFTVATLERCFSNCYTLSKACSVVHVGYGTSGTFGHGTFGSWLLLSTLMHLCLINANLLTCVVHSVYDFFHSL